MLLAGASVAALAASITTAAAAAPLLLGPGGSGGTVNVTTPTDFVVIDSYLLTGDFNNSSTIGNFAHGAGITIGNHSLITGTLDNEAVTGIIRGSTAGILVTDSGVGAIVNNGVIQVTGGNLTVVGIGVTDTTGNYSISNITNNNLITVSATQTVSGAADQTATAGPTDGSVISQSLSAPALTPSATSEAIIDNALGGNLAMPVAASATSTTGNATATGFAFRPIFQDVTAGNVSGASFTNEGNSQFTVTASATAGQNALATAAMDYGVDQIVTAAGAKTSANATIGNTGSLNIALTANASGTHDATANAIFHNTVIHQSASSALSTSAVLSNGGTLDLTASAAASGGNISKATAAFDLFAIHQTADANGLVGSTAQVNLNNSGNLSTLTIETLATATATGAAGAATASALFHRTVIYQDAFGADSATATLANSSTLTIIAGASATAALAANAHASYVDNAISQYATGDGAGNSTALASISNSGNLSTLTIEALATATATAATGVANAKATFDSTVIYQDANSADFVTATLTNSGTMTLLASASAMAGHSANATASFVDTVVSQFAGADGAGNSTALANINNSGVMSIEALATATATAVGGVAKANATFSSTVIHQEARGADFATASLSNSGTLTIMVSASAMAGHSASAHASFNSNVVSQTARADGALGSTALASINNSGNLSTWTIQALATATATEATGVANADALFDSTVIYQDASHADFATATLTNAGTLTILASASALAGKTANATASYRENVVSQYASADGAGNSTALANINNSGVMSIEALATATATAVGGVAKARATFSSTVIYQEARGADFATASLSNSGTLTILVSASAMAGHSASANASFNSNIVSQYATADGAVGSTALASINNSGNLSTWTIQALATATATEATGVANADALFDSTVIYQDASNADFATATLTNAGTLTILASASALAGKTANATAEIREYGIYQTADADGRVGSTALANLNNTGTLSIQTLATATATAPGGIATASATLDRTAIYQEAEGADSNTARLTNVGTLTIEASANAAAPHYAYASASIDDPAIRQFVSTDGNTGNAGLADLNNSGTLKILSLATASATEAGATAYAYANASTGIEQEVEDAHSATVSLENTGTLTFVTSATATAPHFAYADARPDDGIDQSASGDGTAGSTAQASITNSGNFTYATLASASAAAGRASAFATGSTGISNEAFRAQTATASITNSGNLTFVSTATASGGTSAKAEASMDGEGIFQFASADSLTGGTALASLDNTGTILIMADASATATGGDATATATLRFEGIEQEVRDADFATATLINGTTLTIAAIATAVGTSGAFAAADMTDDPAIYQNVRASGVTGSTALANLTNSGLMLIEVIAKATATAGDATANASVSQAIRQEVSGADTAAAVVTNSGTINFLATAIATAPNAFASATVDYGVHQTVTADGVAGSTASASFTNSGVYDVAAVATANGAAKAAANAVAYGVTQDVHGGAVNTAAFTNSGTFTVTATATAHALHATASASAYGWEADSFGTERLTLAGTNSGAFSVLAKAVSDGSANATATGIFAGAGNLAGTISNTSSGKLVVSAIAAGTAGSAAAVGIHTSSAVNDATISNSGTIQVYAQGGNATATAIKIDKSGGSFTPTAADKLTILNDGGTISASVSTDGGVTVRHGVAIDTTDEPNAVAINLKGTSQVGHIFGDINISAPDVITVSNGETDLNGLINDPNYVGNLTIAGGGNLFLADTLVGGVPVASGGWVNQFNDLAGSTLTLELPASVGNATTPPHTPEIFANSANLAGALVLRPDVGLLANASGPFTIVDTAIDPTAGNSTGGNITGAFSSVTSSSLFLAPSVTYTPTMAILNVHRIAFNAISGLTINQKSAASGVEAVYSTSLTGAFGNLVTNLLTQNAATYPHVLDQLAGAEYADWLQSLQWSSGDFNRIISERTALESLSPAAAARRELSWRPNALLLKYDANHDGTLTRDELIAGLEGGVRRPRHPSHWLPGRRSGGRDQPGAHRRRSVHRHAGAGLEPGRLHRLHANFPPRAYSLFDQLDRNGDGKMTPKEFNPPAPSRRERQAAPRQPAARPRAARPPRRRWPRRRRSAAAAIDAIA